MNNYQFSIPNEKMKAYTIMTFIMLCINFFGFGFVFFKTNSSATYFSLFGIIFSAIPWLYFILNKKHIASPIVEISLLLNSFIWFYFENNWVGILLIIFAVIGYKTNKPFKIKLNENGIIYETITIKKYTWSQISNVIYKDDILTIDLKNNTLHQIKLHKVLTSENDELAFNKFCKNCIITAI